MKFNPKKLQKKLDYLPRWAWYMGSLFVAGPVGPVGVYLTFHVLEKMIQEYQEEGSVSGSFSSSFYQDEECTVSDESEIERRWQKTQDSASKAHTAKESGQAIREDADVADVIRSGREAMHSIRHANDLIPDPLLSEQIGSIENSCDQILSILEQRPQLLPQLRTFLRYYLPTTLRLLDARAKLEKTANTPKAREVRQRISDALGVVDKAFRKQVEALDEYRFIDLESEMDVLRDMLRADGLIDEDQSAGMNDPFADVLQERLSREKNMPTGGH